MSDQIQTQIVLDGSQILQALGEIKETMGEIAKKAGLTEKEINEAFAAGTHNAEKYEKQLHETVVANQQLVNSTKKVDDASVAFKKAGDHVDSLTNKTSKARDEFGRFAKGAQTGVGGIKGLLLNGAKLMAGFFAVDKVIQFGKEVFNAAAKYQKYFTMLKVSLGSQREAAEAMGMLKDFAKSTPFELNELTESYIKFVNRGIRLTKQELTQLGDLAASQGKSFDQLTEAILDAGTGEFERLKEFGIKASQQGDKVTLMFKGQTVEVQKSESAIQQAIISMGAYNGIAGGMAEQSKNLGGSFSNLADSVGQFAASLGQKFAGAFSGGIGFLTDLFNGLNNLVKSDTLDDLRADFHSQIDATVDLNAKTLGLVKEYENLEAKAKSLGGETKLSKEEHERLDKVMGQIVDIVPDAATEFDKYGNVLGITTSKVYDFIQAQN
jgi:hypothetical protein